MALIRLSELRVMPLSELAELHKTVTKCLVTIQKIYDELWLERTETAEDLLYTLQESRESETLDPENDKLLIAIMKVLYKKLIEQHKNNKRFNRYRRLLSKIECVLGEREN